MKTQDELNQLRIEYESLTTKLKELNEEELEQVTGGGFTIVDEAYSFIPSSKTLAQNNK